MAPRAAPELPGRAGPMTIWAASSFRRDSSYPRRVTSMGSPRGAILVTFTSVPGVRPMSTRRRFTAPDLLPTDTIVPLWPGTRSSSVLRRSSISTSPAQKLAPAYSSQILYPMNLTFSRALSPSGQEKFPGPGRAIERGLRGEDDETLNFLFLFLEAYSDLLTREAIWCQ